MKEAENTLLLALNFVKQQEQIKRSCRISIMLGKFYIEVAEIRMQLNI